VNTFSLTLKLFQKNITNHTNDAKIKILQYLCRRQTSTLLISFATWTNLDKMTKKGRKLCRCGRHQYHLSYISLSSYLVINKSPLDVIEMILNISVISYGYVICPWKNQSTFSNWYHFDFLSTTLFHVSRHIIYPCSNLEVVKEWTK